MKHLVAAVSLAGLTTLAVLAAGCAPLYSGKAEPLRKPQSKTRPPEADQPIKWTEPCDVDFFADGSRLKRNTPLAISESARADAAMMTALAKDDPIPGVLDAIGKYKAALVADPYNAEATKGLAVAYAKVYFKGCAVKLLGRLSEMADNPTFSADATRMVDSAVADSAFDGFRNDADAALGR